MTSRYYWLDMWITRVLTRTSYVLPCGVMYVQPPVLKDNMSKSIVSFSQRVLLTRIIIWPMARVRIIVGLNSTAHLFGDFLRCDGGVGGRARLLIPHLLLRRLRLNVHCMRSVFKCNICIFEAIKRQLHVVGQSMTLNILQYLSPFLLLIFINRVPKIWNYLHSPQKLF